MEWLGSSRQEVSKHAMHREKKEKPLKQIAKDPAQIGHSFKQECSDDSSKGVLINIHA